MKKILSLILVIISLLCCAFVGCNSKPTPPAKDCYISYKFAIYDDKDTDTLNAQLVSFDNNCSFTDTVMGITLNISKISDVVKVGSKFNLPSIEIDYDGEYEQEVYFWYVEGSNNKLSLNNDQEEITCNFGSENVTIVVGIGPTDKEFS